MDKLWDVEVEVELAYNVIRKELYTCKAKTENEAIQFGFYEASKTYPDADSMFGNATEMAYPTFRNDVEKIVYDYVTAPYMHREMALLSLLQRGVLEFDEELKIRAKKK